MSGIFEHRHVVVADEIDELRHASNVHYLGWIMAAATGHSAALGWPASRYFEFGSAWVVRKHELTYLRPALEGDELSITTWISSVRRASCLRHYRIVRLSDDARLLDATTSWAFIDLQRGSPTRIPESLAEALVNIVRRPDGMPLETV